MSWRHASLGAAALAAAALAACGGADKGEQQGSSPPQVVSAYFRAVDGGDVREMCSYLSRQARRDIARLQNASCDRAMAQEARNLPGSLNAYEVVGQTQAGDSATVRIEGLGAEERIRLRRYDGRWRITDAPGLGL